VPEFRRDALSGHTVIIAANRAARPNEFSQANSGARRSPCPFCAGQLRTPPAVARYCLPGAEGWQVRVVPNLYPALRRKDPFAWRGEGSMSSSPAHGVHEVVIESPRHLRSLAELTGEQAAIVFRAYRDRVRYFRDLEQIVFAMPFKNSGPAAGASLEHLHSQLVALPLVPRPVLDELQTFQSCSARHRPCPCCRMIEQELQGGERIVRVTDSFAVWCPYASRFPFETWIAPRDHAPAFEEIGDRGLSELGELMRDTVARLEGRGSVPAYNYLVRSAPFDISSQDHYHWHIEIIPRIAHAAGFEWGTTIHMNPTTPEHAAATLRGNV
jgi:UDPglucose--hexose-1-phosphate uridylyltransferase